MTTATFVRDISADGNFAGEAFLWKLASPTTRTVDGVTFTHEYIVSSSVDRDVIPWAPSGETVVFVADETGDPYRGAQGATGETPEAGAHEMALRKSGFEPEWGRTPENQPVIDSFNPERN